MKKYIMIVELIGLGLLIAASVHIRKRMARWTIVAIVLLFLDAVMIYVEQWSQTFETLSPVRPIMTYCIYIIQPFIMIATTQIIVPMQKKQLLLTLPWLLTIPLYIVSPWYNLVCYFSADNHYQTGPIYRLPYFIFAFYVLVFLIQCLRYFKKSTKTEIIGVIFLVATGLISIILFSFMSDTDKLDFTDVFTTEILLFYLFLYIHSSKVDPLTGLMNRQCFYKDIKSQFVKVGAVVSIDMNELKWINDVQGHSAGDKALCTVAKCLSAGKNKSVYRLGGDEFIILLATSEESKVLSEIDAIRERLKNTPYVCAIGYAMRTPGENVEETMKRADRAMYENKALQKKAVLESGGELHDREDAPSV